MSEQPNQPTPGAEKPKPPKASTAQAKAHESPDVEPKETEVPEVESADEQAVWTDPEPVEVTLQLGDGPKIKVLKPSVDYTQFTAAHGYKEV